MKNLITNFICSFYDKFVSNGGLIVKTTKMVTSENEARNSISPVISKNLSFQFIQKIVLAEREFICNKIWFLEILI
jgi:hypothetical protein